jgi:hypothetical protein
VRVEELGGLLEEHVGTQHVSELSVDDEIKDLVNLDDLVVVGEITALDACGELTAVSADDEGR